MRVCTGCGVVKDLDQFYKLGKGRSSPDGRMAKCKVCSNNRTSRWYRQQSREYHRMARYGLSEDAYSALLEAQNYSCALCGSTDPRRKQGFVVDHCHETGRLRGLLCHPCNIALGMLGDNVAGLTKAINYLKGKKHVK